MAEVAVIGCGLVGRAWAISFARAGHAVTLWDEAPGAVASALAFAEEILPELAAQDLLDGDNADDVRRRIASADRLEEAVAGASYVQESTPENIPTKQAVFARLDAAAPREAVLASSTSAILPSAFT
jgi:L-gulonate 3-dehydrogenase